VHQEPATKAPVQVTSSSVPTGHAATRTGVDGAPGNGATVATRAVSVATGQPFAVQTYVSRGSATGSHHPDPRPPLLQR